MKNNDKKRRIFSCEVTPTNFKNTIKAPDIPKTDKPILKKLHRRLTHNGLLNNIIKKEEVTLDKRGETSYANKEEKVKPIKNKINKKPYKK